MTRHWSVTATYDTRLPTRHDMSADGLLLSLHGECYHERLRDERWPLLAFVAALSVAGIITPLTQAAAYDDAHITPGYTNTLVAMLRRLTPGEQRPARAAVIDIAGHC